MVGEGGQVKNGQNSDGSGWWERIRRNWMSRATISIGVIKVRQCSRLVSGAAISIPDRYY